MGIVLEMGEPPTERYPFAATTIRAGDEIANATEWRNVPVGLLPPWHEPVAGIATAQVAAGDPLLPALPADVDIPAGWWSISVPLPMAAIPGSQLRLLNSVTGEQIDGVVASAGLDEGFGTNAMVAFAPDDAARAAQVIAGDAFVVMIAGTAGAATTSG